MGNTVVEICCGSVDDVLEAQRAGAHRVELNSSLFLGGLTPTIGALMEAKRLAPGMQVMTMVRPRAGGFCYTQADYRTALVDARELLGHGADGIVFGFLRSDGTVDTERCREMMAVIGEKESVFHRAIDVVPDWRAALDELIALGVTRVLTSGQEPSVYYGIETVRSMEQYAAGRIQIMPGAGVTAKNAQEIAERTGCGQIHIARHKVFRDASIAHNPEIFYGGALYPPEDQYSIIDGDYIRSVCESVR